MDGACAVRNLRLSNQPTAGAHSDKLRVRGERYPLGCATVGGAFAFAFDTPLVVCASTFINYIRTCVALTLTKPLSLVPTLSSLTAVMATPVPRQWL